MKKFILGIAVFVTMAVLCVVSAGAETYNGFQYSVLTDGTVSITGYTGGSSVVEIPSEIDGKKVTVIADDAFGGQRALVSVTMPDTITTLGNDAFNCCESLESISLSDALTSIGEKAFYECVSLKSIYIPYNVKTIGDYAFYFCGRLRTVTLPDSLTSVGDYTFYRCTALSYIRIPNNVTSIGDYAFYMCEYMDYAILSEKLTTIGKNAFYGCSYLDEMEIPGTVSNIGKYAFAMCSLLDTVSIADGVTTVSEGAFYMCPKLTEITVPSSITSIGKYAFGYYFDYDAYVPTAYDNVVINCEEGSAAHTYALESGVSFSLITSEEPVYELGLIIGSKDSNSITLKWNNVSSATGYIIKQYKNDTWETLADITERSYTISNLTSCTDYKFSVSAYTGSGANKVIATTESIDATTDHAYSSAYTIDKQPTCLEDGSMSKHCTRDGCDAKTSVTTIPASNHSYSKTVVEPTYTEQGYTLYDCMKCDYSYKDNYTSKLALVKPAVSATAGNKQVTLSWTAVEGASYYQIIRYNKGEYSVIASITGTSAVVKGLTNGYEYTYLIKAAADDGRTSLSSAVNVTPVSPLSKPVVTATAGDKQVTLSWNAVNGASYYQIIRYNKGAYSLIANISGTSAVVKGLTNDFEYTYLIKAVATDGTTALSSAVNVTPTSPLSKPVVTATSGDKQVTLSWTAVNGASYYQIIRYNKGTYSVVANINGTSAVVKGLTNNYGYTYLIKAVAEDGTTSLSSAVNVTPMSNTSKAVLSATAGDKQATLSWSAVEGASYYQIIRYNKGAYNTVANISGTYAVVKGLTNNFEYTYLIKAVMSDGTVVYSNSVNVTPMA